MRASACRLRSFTGSAAGQSLTAHALQTPEVVDMRSPPRIALEPLPQARRVVMSVEQLIDQERELIAVSFCESSAVSSVNASVPHN